MVSEADFQALKAAKKAAKRAKKAGQPVDADINRKRKQDEVEEDPTATAVPAPIQKPVVAPAAAPTTSWDGFTDQWWPCAECGTDFLFSANEQRFFKEKGFGAKSRCAACTAAKKARFNEESGKGTAAKQREARARCQTCGEIGHFSKNCKEAACFNCGQKGHKSKDCKMARDNSAGGGICFKFQSTGVCARGADCRFAHVKG